MVINKKTVIEKEYVEDCQNMYWESMANSSFFRSNGLQKDEYKKEIYSIIDECAQLGYITGNFIQNEIISFIISFNYNEIKAQNKGLFNRIFWIYEPLKELDIPHNSVYLLAICVKKKYQRKKVASQMIATLIDENPEAVIVSDISNDNSLDIYRSFGFEINQIEEDYYFVKLDRLIKLGIPKEDAKRRGLPILNQFIVDGYREIKGEIFEDDKSQATLAEVKISKFEWLDYQRKLNMCLYDEMVQNNTYYYVKKSKESTTNEDFYNDYRIEKPNEYAAIFDTMVFIPVQYSKNNVPVSKPYKTNHLRKYVEHLNERTITEIGADRNDIAKRLNRLYLGSVNITVMSEKKDKKIGEAKVLDVLLCIDNESDCGVVQLVSKSVPFMITQFEDAVSNCNLLVENEADIYDFLYEEYKLKRMGHPKIYMSSLFNRYHVSNALLSSILLAETFYKENDEDSLGQVVDKEVKELLNLKEGMGQYDRSYVLAYKNTLVEFIKRESGIETRQYNQAVTSFYLEIITLNIASINIAETEIKHASLDLNKISSTKFLKKIRGIFTKHIRTMEFWFISLNYPSSQNSLNMLNKSFQTDVLLSKYNDKKEEIMNVFYLHRDIGDRVEMQYLNFFVFILSLAGIVEFIYNSSLGLETMLLGKVVVVLALIVTYIFSQFIMRRISNRRSNHD